MSKMRNYTPAFSNNPELLKAFLQIKRQLTYVRAEALKVAVQFPENKVAIASWESMGKAYEIALQIMNGEEL